MQRAVLILLVLLPAVFSPPASAQVATDDAELYAATRRLAVAISDPYEAISFLPAPFHVDWPETADRPRSQGALVLWGLEGRSGGNSSFFYIAHFERRSFEEIKDGVRREWTGFYLTDFVQIGARAWRLPVWEQIRAAADGVLMPMRVLQRGDALCCATGQGAIRLDIDRRGRLSVTDIPAP